LYNISEVVSPVSQSLNAIVTVFFHSFLFPEFNLDPCYKICIKINVQVTASIVKTEVGSK
jgi:hypothetical protein